MTTEAHAGYYLPQPSHWPLVGTVGLFIMLGGVAMSVNGYGIGTFLMGVGFAVLVTMLVGWFGTVIGESEGGLFNKQVDVSYRWAMSWFIFSEVMFFAAFFGALYYAREFSIPWLDGQGAKFATGELLWPKFEATWPLLSTPDATKFAGPEQAMGWSGIPLYNTLILLSSGVTVTLAHWALKAANRAALVFWLFVTVALGFTFLGMQIYEYHHAYTEMGLKLTSGIYGTTFFMLTGFHGAHVTIGATMLTVILFRCIKGHFKPDHHFAFEGVAWYWHFVDVVWLGLFIFVYLL
ncbi:MAG: cytochrome c oxidase subunit 3 [Gammaproteobacteria bacterium]